MRIEGGRRQMPPKRGREEVPKSRINKPQLNSDPAKDRVELVTTEFPKNLKKLKLFYEESSETDACFRLMQDIIVAQTAKGYNLPTSTQTKQRCENIYVELTGKGKGAASTMFKRAVKACDGIYNIGIIINHAASVAQDVVGRIYDDLDDIESIISDLKAKIEAEEGDKSKLHSKLSNLLIRKNNFYEQLFKYSKDYGVELGMKQQRNTIESDKVDVLRDKAANDAGWQKADLALRFEGKTYDDKVAMLANAISQDREVNNLIESQMLEDGFQVEILEEAEGELNDDQREV